MVRFFKRRSGRSLEKKTFERRKRVWEKSITRVIFIIILIAISEKGGVKVISSGNLRRVKDGILKNEIKEYFSRNSNPEAFLKDDLIEFINQTLGKEYCEEEIFSSLRELMFKGEIPEYFEIVDKDTAQPTGVLKQRDAVHRDGDWHLAVSILIFDKDGNLLLQKRAPTVAEPDRWEVSASGHLAPGETPQIAILRELEEEVGLKVKPEDLIPIGRLNQFIKIGKKEVKEGHFEGDAYIHHSDDPPNNVERLSLFMYVVSDEERAELLRNFEEGKYEDVSEIKFEKKDNLFQDFRQNPQAYSSAFAMYFSQDYVIHSWAQNFHNLTNYIKTGKGVTAEAGAGKFDRSQKNKAVDCYGISLVTDIEEPAKASLGRRLESLKEDPAVSPFVDFITEQSLHMTIADLITSNKLYNDSKKPITEGDQNLLLEQVIKPAFQAFAERYSESGGLQVKIDGIGMFPTGVLFFSVHIEPEEFKVLKSLREEIKPKLEEAFPGKCAKLREGYVTHITIGYLREGVNPQNNPGFFEKLAELDKELKSNPIEFVIREGKVVIFKDMNSFNNPNEEVLREIEF